MSTWGLALRCRGCVSLSVKVCQMTYSDRFLSNIKYKLYSFEADLKTRKYGINPLFDCFHASYLPILMEIGTEVLIPKIAYNCGLENQIQSLERLYPRRLSSKNSVSSAIIVIMKTASRSEYLYNARSSARIETS